MIESIEQYLIDNFKFDQERLRHIKRVKKMALELNTVYKLPEDKLVIATLLHDATKNLNYQENLHLASKIYLTELLEQIPESCLHAFSASALAATAFKIKDQDTLNAIAYHCTGRKNMSDLEMLVFISDYIEEERDFVSYDLKVLAKENLLKTTLKIMIETKKYLELNMKKVAKITLDAIVYYQNELEELNDR